ncbi:MAG: ATP phosphoribosyltransferase regulatory subunit [Oscillospiraceae bacterium]|nr:ATP phosphoribosyltransferase regulatory subunit [Oscillospiraceae bacterium]
MRRYNLITPEGTKDLLFEECTARREIEAKLMNLFREHQFHEVITPFVEFYDVFGDCFTQESMYKLSDSKGRIIVLRPDSTLPIIRLAQTRLNKEPRPLKLCYNQTIYRANPKEAGRDDEIAQCGVELIGGGDCKVLPLAVKALELIGIKFLFEIGTTFELIKSLDIFKPQNGEVVFNPKLTSKRSYYTGIFFNGYIEDYGKPILSGGQYKINDIEGEGFSVNVSAIAALQAKGDDNG